jgi:hypothetical protein
MKKIRNQLIVCGIIIFASVRSTYSQQSGSVRSASDYGASNSLTLNISGFDYLSAYFRFYLNDKYLLMTGFGYEFLGFDGYVENKIAYTVTAGGTYFVKKRLKETKKNRIRVIHSGIYCLGGYTFGAKLEPFGPLSQSHLSAGFHYEIFLREKTGHSFSLLLGPSMSILHSKANYNFDLFDKKTKVTPGVFWAIQFNLFTRHKK